MSSENNLQKTIKKKKISLIGSVGLPANYGGWETLVDQLTIHMKDNYDFTVYCSRFNYSKKMKSYNDAQLVYVPLNANGMQSIFYDLVSMVHAIRYSDVLMILGVSGCVFLPFLRLFTKKRMVVNIDGIEWKRAKWGRLAKWFLKLSEKIAVRYADEVITDNLELKRYVQKTYSKSTTVIAYGGDHIIKANDDLTRLNIRQQEYFFLEKKYSFSVCRIEPENNIDLILEAFSQCKDANFVIVGNWDNSPYGIRLKQQYLHFENIFLLSPIYDQEVLALLRSKASRYIHGHSVGGTNPSLVEAMSLGLNIAAFDVCFNKETTEYQAQYFSTTQDLIAIIKGNDTILDNGDLMYEIASRRYQWRIIASQYKRVFDGD